MTTKGKTNDSSRHRGADRTPARPSTSSAGAFSRRCISSTAWRKETGDDLLASRQAMQVGPQLQCTPGATRQIAQLLRTQAQEGKRDIEALYLKAVNNATQFIYIENQYFRWPPLAEAIKKAAIDQTRAGRDPGLHGALHLFVITNATEDSVGSGTVNTQRMLESLGRADTIPEVTKLRRIDQAKAQAAAVAPSLGELLEQQALLTMTSLTDALGGGDVSSKAREAQQDTARDNRWRQAVLSDQIREIESSRIVPDLGIPGLKVHLCSLVAPDSPAGKPWMPVYVHSKLMIVNDVFTTHGSANINTRSMQVDSELNIAHEWASVTRDMRRRLWKLHTAGLGAQDDPGDAFRQWGYIINRNKTRKSKKLVPYAPLVEFYYGEAKLKDID